VRLEAGGQHFVGGRLEAWFVATVKDDRRAGACQTVGQRQADTLRRSGNQSAATVQSKKICLHIQLPKK
jgi:hypothetical protein